MPFVPSRNKNDNNSEMENAVNSMPLVKTNLFLCGKSSFSACCSYMPVQPALRNKQPAALPAKRAICYTFPKNTKATQASNGR